MMNSAQPAEVSGRPLRCRLIEPADMDGLVALLLRGFRGRDEAYWRQGLDRMAARALPKSCPTFGYVMESDGQLVGVILTLYAAARQGVAGSWRCNLSSWYVDPAFRAYASLLDRFAMRDRAVTFINISAARHTVAMHEARGFTRYCRGQTAVLPWLGRALPGVEVLRVGPDTGFEAVAEDERDLMRDHAAYGCLCLVARDAQGSQGFVFLRRPIDAIKWRLGFSPVSYFHLIYTRSLDGLPRFAAALGRHLLRHHAMPWIVIDADGPIEGLYGHHFASWGMRLKRGPEPVSPSDLAYTELVMFGP